MRVLFLIFIIMPHIAMAQAKAPVAVLEATTAQPLIDENKISKKTIAPKTAVAIGLDVLGVAAIGFGIYQNSKMNSHVDKAKIYNKSDPEYKKAVDAHTIRNISYIAGSALLASGIAIHIFF
jgi:hypothetical protein